MTLPGGLIHKLRSARMRLLLERMEELANIRDRILTTLDESPPLAISDGGVIAKGFHAELDELREISQNSRGFIARRETQERENTGIASLKVRHNNVFGFFIEVSKANAHRVPDSYSRKQTLVNRLLARAVATGRWQSSPGPSESRGRLLKSRAKPESGLE